MQTATLAGGCFWCVEAVYRELQGVASAVSGYVGGHVAHPSYQEVCSGSTGHAEAVEITFDPAQISYRDLLEVFFSVHDPTTLNRQGDDIGAQYRSAIFFHDDEQRAAAECVIAELTAAKTFSAPIVTEIVPASTFWPAENYHQDYLAHNPQQPYCRLVVSPKVEKFRKKFSVRLKGR